MQKLKKNLPASLTIFRLVAVPFLVLFFFFENDHKNMTAAIFLLVALTDHVVSILVKKWGIESKFLEIIDPVADRLIVITSLALLIEGGKTFIIIPAIGVMCREVFVASIREFLEKATQDDDKFKIFIFWKNIIQLIAITLLLYTPNYSLNSNETDYIFYTGYVFLWISFLSNIYSGYRHFELAKDKDLI